MFVAIFSEKEEKPALTVVATDPVQTFESEPQTEESRPVALWIPVQTEGGVVDMQLEEYVLSVLLQEMPADFADEALKAQAVAARTYTLRRFMLGYKHQSAAVCTEASCCQAFCTEGDFLASGGDEKVLERMRFAVESTRGEYVAFENEPIEATYFSCSGGMTEAAVAVWGQEVSYLQATESPGEEGAAHYQETLYFTKEALAKKLGVAFTGASEGWVQNLTYTAGGGVDSVNLCGKEFTGTELRQKLGLRSTNVTFRTDPSGIHITTKGYGHRVGMSQYGANAMALSGSDYRQILSHYYEGTVILEYGG